MRYLPVRQSKISNQKSKICWLKDRKGRTLDYADLQHYQRIVVALRETIRLMASIDETIEAQGGWPGATAVKGT